ncbi:MAG TPA: phosphatidylglycerophosphatase A [bacterium]|nr:phosphatidylglycerophosphatase A [bacterium]HQQ00429.1 phosphatidylglycerophosphatase A [bacterium]
MTISVMATSGRIAALTVATGLGSGYLPISGTCGSAVILLLHRFLFPNALTAQNWLSGLILLLVITAIAVFTAEVAERHYGVKDDGRVTIDEFAGYLVTVYCLPAGWVPAVAAFFVFRVLDIIKPPPAHALQDLHGGIGIVIDDVLAGVYGCLFLNILFHWIL